MYGSSRGQDADFDEARAAKAKADIERLQAEWRRSDEAVEGMALGDTFAVDGEAFSLRMVYVHMIGEYSRHNGHADVIREAIDGVAGR